MTFISYAQNFEDVMLWRALKDVVGGCYIDVGANDPLVHSVTKAFYDQGWRGVNIEPMQQYYQQLCEQRTEEVNLSVGAGEKNGFMTYYEIPDTGLSTVDEAVAEQHKKAGWKVFARSIAVMSLSTVCEHYINGPIHFLKVDVEGAEKQVLMGMDFTRYRPWIVVVESTIPMSQQENFVEWEYILLDNKYQFVYFDGLNRYYISNEKTLELKSAFLAPPNFFDSFILYSEYNLSMERKYLEEELKEKEKQRQQLEEALKEKEKQRQQLEEALKEKEEQRQQLEEALKEKEKQRQQLEEGLKEKEEQHQQLEEALKEKEEQSQQLEEALNEKEDQRQKFELLFNSIEKSRSWRFAKPLRLLAGYARRIKSKLTGKKSLVRSLKVPIKAVLIPTVHFIMARPRLKVLLLPMISRFPGLKARLKRMETRKYDDSMSIQRVDNIHNLSPRAAQIYTDLLRALAEEQDKRQRKD